MMHSYPARSEVAEGEEMKCPFCNTDHTSFTALVLHLGKAYNITKGDLKGHWVHTEYLKERRPAKLGQEEAEWVGLCYSEPGIPDETRFTCLGCDKVWLKTSCAGHMASSLHGVPKAVTKTWACVKDGNTISWAQKKRKKDADFAEEAYLESHLLFTRAVLGSQGKPQAAKGSSQPDNEKQEPLVEGSDVEEEEVEAEEVGGVDEDEVEEGGTFWRRGFVQVDARGNLQTPLVFKASLPEGGVEWDQTLSKKTPPWRQQATSCSSSSADWPLHSRPQPGPVGDVPRQPALESVALETLALVKQQLHLGWKEKLPVVRVRASASSVALPLAKGSGEVKRSGPWPKELHVANLPLAEFEKYLYSKKVDRLKEDQVKDHKRALNRFFGLVEYKSPDSSVAGDVWASVESDDVACDPGFLVGFCLSTTAYDDFEKLKLLGEEYNWSLKMVEALLAFCKWHVWKLDDMEVHSTGTGPWVKFKATIDRLATTLEDRFLKRLRVAGNKKILAKQQEDLKRIRALPSIADFRKAVEAGYLDLLAIHKKFVGTGAAEPTFLPRNVQGLANSCLVGAMWLDGFGGRKMEWEIMKGEDVDKMFSEGKDFLICPHHKTSSTYGSLAKWLSPGVRAAFELYRQLPRRPGVDTFLVPASEATTKVDVPKAFATFCSQRFPSSTSKPTVNLMRKFFHKTLMEITKDEKALKEFMKLVDPHSVPTMDRHYILREPEDDVALAKLLVKQVLGATATFPTHCPKGHSYKSLAAAFDSAEKDPEAQEEAGADDEPLEWWPMARCFGISEPLPAITDDLASGSLGPVPLPGPPRAEKRSAEVEPAQEEENCPGASEPSASSNQDYLGGGAHSTRGNEGMPPNPAEEVKPPPAKRGRQSQLLASEKEYVETLQKDVFGLIQVAPNSFLEEWHRNGVAAGVLRPEVTQEQLRHVCTYWHKKATKAKKAEEAKEAESEK